MTRSEKTLTAVIVAANLLLGVALVRRADLGRLLTTGGAGDEAARTDSSPAPPADSRRIGSWIPDPAVLRRLEPRLERPRVVPRPAD